VCDNDIGTTLCPTCVSSPIGTIIFLFEKSRRKAVGIRPTLRYSGPDSETSVFAIETIIKWHMLNCEYLIMHWPKEEAHKQTFLLQDHILRELYHQARWIHELGATMLRRMIYFKLTEQFPLHLPSKIQYFLNSLRFGGDIMDHSVFELDFTVPNHTDIFLEHIETKFTNDFPPILLPDIIVIITEYAPICKCKCRFSLPTMPSVNNNRNMIIGCDIVACNKHIACTCCTSLICSNKWLCLSETTCGLCTNMCTDCNARFCADACCDVCVRCNEAVCKPCNTQCDFCDAFLCKSCTVQSYCHFCERTGCPMCSHRCSNCQTFMCLECAISCELCDGDSANYVCSECIPKSRCATCHNDLCSTHAEKCNDCNQVVCKTPVCAAAACKNCNVGILCATCIESHICGFCHNLLCDCNNQITKCACGNRACSSCSLECEWCHEQVCKKCVGVCQACSKRKKRKTRKDF